MDRNNASNPVVGATTILRTTPYFDPLVSGEEHHLETVTENIGQAEDLPEAERVVEEEELDMDASENVSGTGNPITLTTDSRGRVLFEGLEIAKPYFLTIIKQG